MKRRLSLLLLLSISILSTPSWALGKLGHQLVCQLSFELLPPANQQKVIQLLATLPVKDQAAINRYNHQPKNQIISFADSCTWADAIKREDSFARFKSWHYLNVAREHTGINENSCEKDCLTQAISYHQQQLIKAQDKYEKVAALMFLSHWLGDIHQPLHVSFASDLGGNKNKVIPAVGRCGNLHWYWDECLLYPLNKPEENFDYSTFKHSLYRGLKTALSTAPVKQWRHSTIIDWANESLTIVRSDALQYCHNSGEVCQSNQDQTIKLTNDYHLKYQALLKQRMMQAAVRLSEVLNNSL
ncbi:hypothetical protein tinsulaeT_22750 [Thalassotalea insulae]|uniref:S1/P1 Nuclease n=1 Tax=Thalassotalea insulae TaxID=2056778 RepID=A0ABQ6GW44_9GAMM|nr:S1/P1 nuclease [Thalassotalea insulae]GLX78935.1 hypothetical protein tinsulaeT_22750 [Thalassotalea insulae]